jgi:hypothetical protein
MDKFWRYMPLALLACDETTLYSIRDIVTGEPHETCLDEFSRTAYNAIMPREITPDTDTENATVLCPRLEERILTDYEACMTNADPQIDFVDCFLVYGNNAEEFEQEAGKQMEQYDRLLSCFEGSAQAPLNDINFEIFPGSDISCEMFYQE